VLLSEIITNNRLNIVVIPNSCYMLRKRNVGSMSILGIAELRDEDDLGGHSIELLTKVRTF